MTGDEKLYQQYLAGDETAADELVARYGDTLTLYIYGFLDDLQEGTDSQCIILGPGDVASAHSVHERISKKQLFMAVEIYQSMAMEICRTGDGSLSAARE